MVETGFHVYGRTTVASKTKGQNFKTYYLLEITTEKS